MKTRITTYTFDASAKTITFASSLDIEGFMLITNVVDNVIIYNFAEPTLGGTFATNTLTLTYDTTLMSDTDELMIIYEDGVNSIAVSSAPTTTVQATDLDIRSLVNTDVVTAELSAVDNAVLDDIASKDFATQTTLAEIKTNTDKIPAQGQALASASVPVVLPASQITTLTPPSQITGYATEAKQLPDNHQVTVSNITSTPVISGFATETKQDTIIGHVDGIETLLTTIEENQLPDGHNVTVDNASIEVTGTVTANTGLAQPLTETQLRATAVPVSGDFYQATQPVSGTITANAGTNLNTSSLALETTNTSIKNAVEIIDNAIVGNEMQVDVVASLPAGTNAIGKLAANNAVDIGDVTINNASGASAVNIQDGGNSITVDGTVTVNALPSGTNLVGKVSSADRTDAIYNDTTVLTPKYAVISGSASGNNTLVAAVSGKKIRMLSLLLVASGTVNVKFQSGAGGTDLTGLMNLVANTGFSLAYSPIGHFETASNTLLNMSLSAAVAVGGVLTYVEV
jgi:hypothetical protein